MRMGRAGAIHRDLGQLFEGRAVTGLGEVQLLDRFVDCRDEPAFAALMARHGPMVLGVCRRLLADPNDVEDAFQATFLVLVRRAGSLRGRDQLAPWLFGVARKVATRARLDLARRRTRERSRAEETASISGIDDENRELGRALIEEIDRLPESLREPIVLCCLERLTYDEAATRLKTTAPAIRGKLSRGRDRLRDRLTRRGFAPSAAVLGALLAESVASASVPRTLLMTTTRAMLAGSVPIGVEALAKGVIGTMILTKSKILATALVAFGVAGSTVGLNAQDSPKPASPKAEAPEAERFGQIEKKLDRLIEALEGSTRRRDPFVEQPPLATPPPAAPVPPLPPQPPAALPSPAIRGMMGARTTVTSPDAVPSRLDAFEQKLESLEARIANLERRLGREETVGDQVPRVDPAAPARRTGTDVRTRNRATRPIPSPAPATSDDDVPVPTPGASAPTRSRPVDRTPAPGERNVDVPLPVPR